jgi:ligand-binding sensor domain-containing protein
MNIKLSIAFILLLNFSIGLFAQDGLVQKNAIDDALNFHLLDVESGLSNNFINSIEQDSLGFIWIGTADGLNRYDGTQFINYNSNPDNGLSNNNISKIKYHKQTNELIIATDDGLNRYIPELDEFKPYLNTNDKLHKFVNHSSMFW